MPTPARPAEATPPLDDDQDTFGPSGTSDGPSDVRGLTPPDDRVPDQPVEQSGMPPPNPDPDGPQKLFPDPPPMDLPENAPEPPVNDPDPNNPTGPLLDAGLAEDRDGVR